MASDRPVVRDLVIPIEKYPHVNEYHSLHDAVAAIISYTYGTNDRIRYDELLVFNDRNQLSGLVTLQDILQCLHPRLKEVSKGRKFEGKKQEFPDLTILWEGSFFVECTKGSKLLIKDCMSPIKHIVKGDDPVLKALAIMLKTKEVILPVIDEDRITGVIRLKEIFKEIANKCRL
jgi:predicted transcriptional regulator